MIDLLTPDQRVARRVSAIYNTGCTLGGLGLLVVIYGLTVLISDWRFSPAAFVAAAVLGTIGFAIVRFSERLRRDIRELR